VESVEAVSRAFGARFAHWEAGEYAALWQLIPTEKLDKSKNGDKAPGYKQNVHLVVFYTFSKTNLTVLRTE